MKDAYVRWILKYPYHAEYRGGCPTLLIDSQPSLVCRKTPEGNIEIFEHYRYKGLGTI